MKYLVCIVALVTASAWTYAGEIAPRFKHVTVDAGVKIGYGVAIADVNGDRRLDILLADQDLVVWYENPAWTKHVIAEKLTPLDHVCIAAADIDGDGKAEIAVGAGWNPSDTVKSGAVFLLEPGTDRTKLWTPVPLPHEPTVHRMRWLKDWQGQFRLVMAPLHGRANKNGQGAGVKILAYRKPAEAGQPWNTQVLNDSLHMTHNFDPVQWDDEVADEMLIASREGIFVLNWIDGRQQLQPIIGDVSGQSKFAGAGEVRHGRLPNGSRYIASIEPMHGQHAVVYQQGARGSEDWQRTVLDDSLRGGHALACGDLLQTGSDQLVVGWREKDATGKVGIKIFAPSGASASEWKQERLDDNTMACEDLALADLDQDGRLDVIAAGRATHNLKVYFNSPGAAR